MTNQPILRLYNTLSRQKEAFQPINAENVRMYVCGPTVYDYAHIGNARPIIVFDVLFRLLRHLYGEQHVTYVRNITDVDDKINARAAEEGVPISDVTSRTTVQFHADVAALGVLPPSIEPRATDHITEMRVMIDQLIDKGFAYVADGHVLFDTGVMSDYGALSQRPLDDMIAGARVEIASYKKNPMDFVLWKPSPEGIPAWPSPGGIDAPGRPGWHIECSAMAAKHLGNTFDIHGGGVDLVFPHHENEVAQSRCAHGTDVMANVWMHNGFVQVEGQKMSKSLGNFITINDLLEAETFGGRKWPGEVLRLAMLMTHYREPVDWTVRRLEEAEAKLKRWKRLLQNAGLSGGHDSRLDALYEALSNDLSTPKAVQVLDNLAKESDAGNALAEALYFLGLDLSKFGEVDDARHSVIKQRIAERVAALTAKDWSKADQIRAELLEEGIQLLDYRDPDTGERRTKWERG